MGDDMQTITEQAAKDARDVFESYGSKAREAIDYMEQLIYAALRETERALPAASAEDVRAGALKEAVEAVAYWNRLAAIAKLGAGDGLVERATAALEGVTDGPWLYRPDKYDDWGVVRADDFHLCQVRNPNCYTTEHLNEARAAKIDPWETNARFIAFARQWVPEAAARIAALTAQNRELALDVLASSGQAQEAYAAQLAAEAERDALRAKVARLEGVLTDMPKAVLRTTVCQGPQWPDDRPGVWLAALEACAKSVQEAVDAALTDGGSNE